MAIDDLTAIARRSVREFPTETEGFSHFVLTLATAADRIPEWGNNPVLRDMELRKFVPTESWIASTISSLSARNAAFSWTLEGAERTCNAVQEALHLSEFGKGWTALMQKLSHDLYSQDNGAFIEVIRDQGGAFRSLAHLDAARCTRTGNPDVPVIYQDIYGGQHKLNPSQVVDLTDFPSPVETMNGMQMCAVSRVLRIAQILRDVALRKSEKLTGRFAGAIHVLSGITSNYIEDAMKKQEEESDRKQRFRYQPPTIIGTIDPHAEVKHTQIPIADIPEGFDEESAVKYYIAVLALAFQCEYQDLAPLPGGNLGTSQQAQVLHLKAKGKGPELFQKIIEHTLNFRVLPQNVQFKFVERDFQGEQIQSRVAMNWSQAAKNYIESGALTPQIVRQMMEDRGDLKHEYLEMMGEGDLSPEEIMTDESREMIGEEHLTDDEKELREGDYWWENRKKLESQYEDDMYHALRKIRKRVIDRVREEVGRES